MSNKGDKDTFPKSHRSSAQWISLGTRETPLPKVTLNLSKELLRTEVSSVEHSWSGASWKPRASLQKLRTNHRWQKPLGFRPPGQWLSRGGKDSWLALTGTRGQKSYSRLFWNKTSVPWLSTTTGIWSVCAHGKSVLTPEKNIHRHWSEDGRLWP